jgi:HD-GYP domain-containing protein (c-di-GMP phosphodiesterase class II)
MCRRATEGVALPPGSSPQSRVAGVPAGNALPTDERRKHLLWLAVALVGVLAVALVVLVCYGVDVPGITHSDRTEPWMLIGLLALLTLSVAYLLDKEREHRIQNTALIRRLHEAAAALDARVERLNRLSETSMRLAGSLDVERISELVVEALVTQVHADAASFVLMDRTNRQWLHTRSTGPLAEVPGEPDDPVALAAAAVEEAPTIHDLGERATVAERIRAWDRVRGAISAPVKVSAVVSGALAAMRAERFEVEDLNLLTTLANMASRALENAELHQQLRESYFRTLHVLARSLAARDPYSAAHGEAVTWISCELARKLGLDGEVVPMLEAYGPLHDLGKVGIADAVLMKAGPLEEDELELCRQHVLIGEEIVRPLDPGDMALAIVRNHHERWDGSGYPDGLVGEQIPLSARIVAVADVFHAAISHRPYKAGEPPFEAVHEIKRLSGVHFDPEVVEAFVQFWDTGGLAKFTMRLGQVVDRAAVGQLRIPLAAPVPLPDRAEG